jgi:hypothetical protein
MLGSDYAKIVYERTYMRRRIKKTVVPPREERMEKIGDPKTPKMGGITPKSIEVPEVDDLLKKMNRATAHVSRQIFLPPYRFVSFDLVTEAAYGRCRVGCDCEPCRSGACGSCLREADRRERREVYEMKPRHSRYKNL